MKTFLLLPLTLCLIHGTQAQGDPIRGREMVGVAPLDPTKTPLYLIGLTAFSGGWPAGDGMVPAVTMALEDINSRDDVLRDYQLIVLWNDTQCNPGLGVDLVYASLYTPPTKVAILGAACSIVSEPVAESSHLWNVAMVSYGSSSPALSNKDKYKRFLRVQCPETLTNPAKIALLKFFNWKRVATVHEAEPLFSTDNDDFRLRAAAENMTLVSTEIITDNPFLQVQNLKKHDARIIVLNCYEKCGVSVMCEAYKANMYGRRYVWIIPAWYSPNWEDHAFPDISCTRDEIQAVTKSSAIMFNFQALNERPSKGLAGMNASDFMTRYFKLNNNGVFSGTDYAGLAYDSVWAIALGLNATVESLKGTGQRLEDFTYTNQMMGDLLLRSIWDVEFVGVKGDVFFDENGDSPREVQIFQYRGDEVVPVGLYMQGKGYITWYDEIGITWKDGVPKDATTYVRVQVFVSRNIYVAICAFAGVGVLLALGFLVFNIYFRNQRLIRMSSPVMNNVMLVGCIVVYATVFFQELSPSNVSLLCRFRTISMMVGFSLSFGALFAKTWRVYVIFTNTTKRVILRDSKLLLLVSVLVLVDVIAVVTRELLDSPTVVNTIVEEEILEDGDLIVEKESLACQSEYSLYFQAAVFVYKGLLLIFGAFLAWQTRKVNIPALNDSKYIGMCVYNVTVLSILGVVLLFALGQQLELQYALVSAFIIFGTSIVQLTIFIPKVLKLHNTQNKVDDTDDQSETTTTFTVANKAATTVADNKDIQELRQELEITKKALAEANSEIARLKANK